MSKNMFDLTGKVVLITGGNGGIGFGMAEAIARAGADVAIWGTNQAKTDAAVEKLAAHGGKVAGFACNVADQGDVDDKMVATLGHFGRLDGCIANAGVSGRGARSFLDIDYAEWRRVLDVNLDGVYFTYQAALRHMVARAEGGDPGGRLACVSSLASVSGAARSEHYAASKGALNAMTFALAVEFARYGITANAILPGWIATDMTENAIGNEKFAQNVAPRIPTRRWGEPADFGGIATYLMSDASAYHTGQLLQVDGGYLRY
ncbi:SDR family NAD(P)-dependent oxidoreductase [Chachezhania sediminis]|uniref:SDR family NAD(P)-dependent oxidoreductase n=1 Tax=Chachezhania sediminis TaxID=2599291 RepID=UPI0018EEE62F|nr:SDR family NAD(P)-dependent oxidoreductase [Chachezhania sediminis]